MATTESILALAAIVKAVTDLIIVSGRLMTELNRISAMDDATVRQEIQRCNWALDGLMKRIRDFEPGEKP